jgi:hypothetical protein
MRPYAVTHGKEAMVARMDESVSQHGVEETPQSGTVQLARWLTLWRSLAGSLIKDGYDIGEKRTGNVSSQVAMTRAGRSYCDIGAPTRGKVYEVIADFLFEHDIPYKYECNFWWNGINYRPDFTIFAPSDTGIVVEYFGLTGDPDYDEMTDKKRQYWRNKPKRRILTG